MTIACGWYRAYRVEGLENEMKQQGLGLGAPQDSGVNAPEAPIKLIRGYLNEAQQTALLEEASAYPLSSPIIKIYGKQHAIPRAQVWFGNEGCDYLYSGLFIEALPWPKYARLLQQKLKRDFGLNANGVLVNRYADGSDSIGWHSDDEPEIANGSDIASVTLGATRDFFIRHKSSHHKINISLESGDLLLMQWPMQKEWEHSLPKRMKVMEPRLNFTFRTLVKDFHKEITMD
ncbi:2OG-Fe(II) oxygenase [Shewanella sediminis HAW-EB3]|uniref:2OG-Fe(II) oxygenase n=2 Tax=Shewanella sediminis TaxID=271097 RepID=A8FYW6_SHESH|nr:2OG-Fe(II) oxygenase [Shewanella sediminis HAW-EB3]